MRLRSIRARLLTGTAFGVAVTFAISGVLVYVLARSQIYAQFDDALVMRARALSALVEQEGTTIETELGRQEIETEYFQLWNAGGAVLQRSKSLGASELPRSDSELEIENVTLPDGAAGRQVVFTFHPHQDPEDGPPGVPARLTFALARSTHEADATIAALGRVLALVGIAATLLALGLLAAAVRFGLHPVRELALAIAELRESNLAARLDAARSPAELRPVVDRLNDLLARLERAFARERELTAEVAHELRTPLAGLRATIELALDRERTPERYRVALGDCLSICVQTARTVESLLSLARLDAGMVAAVRTPVELDELVREAVVPHAARVAERKLVLHTELAQITRETDRDKLRVVLDNVIENATTYVDEAGTVTVELTAAHIVVSNTGCTMAKEDLAHVFDRFWRGDKARSSGTHGGVGLALCRKLVELLGGTITAAMTGDRFVITISW